MINIFTVFDSFPRLYPFSPRPPSTRCPVETHVSLLREGDEDGPTFRTTRLAPDARSGGVGKWSSETLDVWNM